MKVSGRGPHVTRRSLVSVAVSAPLLGACGADAVDPSSSSPSRVVQTAERCPWGTNTFLHKEVELWKREQTLTMAKAAGFAWIKQQFPWEEIEQPRKGQFFDVKYVQGTWDKFDELVRLSEVSGLKMIARVDRPPAWARLDKTRPQGPPDNLNDFGDFLFLLASRYKGRVNHFQVWNEPNLGEEWTGKPDPIGYTAMLRVAYRRIKEANPQASVLAAPLAMNMELGPIHLNEMDFLDQMYLAGAKGTFDILSANAYGMDRPPTDPPSRQILNFRRVEFLRAVMEKHGDGATAVWFNEYGWNASPKDMPREELIWQRVTDRQQADWTVEGVEYARRNWPWAGVFCTWYFRQVGDISPSKSEYYFRLVDPDFTPRPVYHAIKAATARK